MQSNIGSWKPLKLHLKDRQNTGVKVYAQVFSSSGPTLNWVFRVEDSCKELAENFVHEEIWKNSSKIFRGKDLWRENCFEVFLKPTTDCEDYFEWNFMAPHFWDFYAFTDFRINSDSAKKNFLTKNLASNFSCYKNSSDNYELAGQIFVSQISLLSWSLNTLQTEAAINLSCILQTRDKTQLHFALNHPSGDKPDFHNKAGFIPLEKAVSTVR